MIIVSSGSGTVTNINTTAPLSGGPITTSGTITTAMTTNKLIGRSTAGTGAMEEISIGTGLNLSGGTLSSTGGATAAGNTNDIQFNNAGAFAADSDLRWIIANDRLVLGQENTADTNSRMVIIGKGSSTQNTFVVHNQTGTNNALIVRDDGRIGIGTASPGRTLSVNGNTEYTNQTAQISVTAQGGSSTGILCTTGNNGSVSTNIDLNSNSSNLNIKVTHNAYTSSLGKAGSTLCDFTPNNTGALNQINNNIRTGASGNSASPAYTWSFTNSGDTPTAANLLSSQRMKLTRESLLLNTDTEIISSILTINSTTKGVLLPRLTTTEVNNIATPATGLTVYNTTENTLCFYNGTSWQKVNHSNL